MNNNVEVVNRLSELADKRNIHLVNSNLPDSVKSVYVCNGKVKMIMVNNSITAEQRAPEVAFCLSCAILHKNLDCNIYSDKDLFDKRKLEARANKFANKLLKLIS